MLSKTNLPVSDGNYFNLFIEDVNFKGWIHYEHVF